MKDLIISAPYYSGQHYEIRSNIYEASMMAEYYWRQGYNVFCPHMNTAFFGGLVSEETFLAACIERIQKADIIAFHPSWEYSSGCRKERLAAKSSGLELLYPLKELFMTRR